MSFLNKLNPFSKADPKALASKGVGGVMATVINAAKFAGKAQAMIEVAMADDPTDDDDIPEYKEALMLVMECWERIKSQTIPLFKKSFGHLVEIKNDCMTEVKFHAEKFVEVAKIAGKLFVETMNAEKETHVALLAPPKEESQSA